MIAGLRKDQEILVDERVPFFGDIPFIGRLFRSGTDQKTLDELLVLLTPYIVGGDKLEFGNPGAPMDAMKPYLDYSAVTPSRANKNPIYESFKEGVLFE